MPIPSDSLPSGLPRPEPFIPDERAGSGSSAGQQACFLNDAEPVVPLRVTATFTPEPEWTTVCPSDTDHRIGVFRKIQHPGTGTWYTLQPVPAGDVRIETIIEAMRSYVSFNGVLRGPAAVASMEMSDVRYSDDRQSAWFYFQRHGTLMRGKAFVILQPGLEQAVLAQAMWDLEHQHEVLPLVDRMNASIVLSERVDSIQFRSMPEAGSSHDGDRAPIAE